MRGGLLLAVAVVILSGGCVHVYPDRPWLSPGCCSTPCGASVRSERLAEAIRGDFLASWQSYKQARLSSDVPGSLIYHPDGHKVRVSRDGLLKMTTRIDAELEIRRRHLKVEDVDGPHVFADTCGCRIWVVGRLRVLVVPPNSSVAVTEEESYLATLGESASDWRMVAVQNGIDNPRSLPPGGVSVP